MALRTKEDMQSGSMWFENALVMFTENISFYFSVKNRVFKFTVVLEIVQRMVCDVVCYLAWIDGHAMPE